MNSIIEQMLDQHESTTLSDKKNSIKEVVQEIMLCWWIPDLMGQERT